jgi:hypothetical protein
MNGEYKRFHVSYLQSGGLITNYNCSSRCKHCLYACAPGRKKDYIGKKSGRRVLRRIRELGCRSIHIGGGEPFLNIEKLKEVLQVAREEYVAIQYVETNSSWYKDFDSACRILEDLKKCSLSCLLVSISPFHNEYIPFYKVKGVIAACRETGISMFPWISDFYRDIDTFPESEPNAMSKYLESFGSRYLKNVLSKYWVHPGGRALNSFSSQYGKRRVEDLLVDTTGCLELADTSHFHFDLYEHYIPGLCSGIRIHLADMGSPLSKEKYPFLHLLYNRGIAGFYRMATEEFDFKSRAQYSSKCHLCLDIRSFLVQETDEQCNEFGPEDFYYYIETED